MRARLALLLLACGVNACALSTGGLTDRTELEGGIHDGAAIGWWSFGAEMRLTFTDSVVAHTPPRSGGLALLNALRKERAVLAQYFSAVSHCGKRVRFRGWVKTHRVGGWAGLWIRVDSEDRENIAYDDMADRAIRGTTDWTRYDVVIDVPEKATIVNVGIVLSGSGQVWLDTCSFEVVDATVDATGVYMQDRPRRWSFDLVDDAPTNLAFDDEFDAVIDGH